MDVPALFAAIDRLDATAFASFIAEDGVFQMGSYLPVQGRPATESFVAGFFGTLCYTRHSGLRTYEAGENLFVEGRVAYGLPNGKEVEVPFLNRLRLEGGLAAEYLIYLDPTPVAAALAA